MQRDYPRRRYEPRFELVEIAPGVTADEVAERTGAPVRVPVGV